MKVRRIFLSLSFGTLAALGAYILFVVWHIPACNRSDQIGTAADAIEFGKYWLRRDEALPSKLGLSSLSPLDAELAKPECCSAQPLDPVENGGRKWKVTIEATQDQWFKLRYVVSFSACRRGISEDRQTSKFPQKPGNELKR